MFLALAWLLVLAPLAWAQPTQVGCASAQMGCGPAIVLGASGGAAVIVPAAGAADVNCPATIPAQNANTTGLDTLNAVITCLTPARTTTVQSVSLWVSTGTVGAKIKCSVYTLPGGYVAGTTAIPKLAAACDTVEWVAASASTNGWITLPTTGTCTLAASTRYQIVCNQGSFGYFMYYHSAACTIGGVQCNQERTSVTYASGALPDPWTANNQGTATFAYYLTVQ